MRGFGILCVAQVLLLTTTGLAANRAPVISDVSVSQNHVQTGVSVTFTAVASDPDSDTLTFTWDFGDGTTAAGNPVTHAYTSEGSFLAVVTVSDGTDTASGTVTTMVVPPSPGAPSITSILAATGIQGAPFSYTITASGDAPITFGASPLPAGITLTGATLSGTPTELGITNVVLTASNAISSTSKTLVLTIRRMLKLTPDAATAGSPAFSLTVDSADFTTSSSVAWNGSSRPTSFVNNTRLTAAISASDLLAAGRMTVDVSSGVTSNGNWAPATFFVYSGPVGTWIVSNTSDSGAGSLRFALDNCRRGDSIAFDAGSFAVNNSDAATIINVKSALPALDDGNVTIDAQDRRVTINGSAAGSTDGLVITSSGNKIMGLTIIGFTGSGVSVQNGSDNVLGGSRTTGTGPNGQGLRIANNGSFGIQITGANATGNVVKGCWVGLDYAGLNAQPNLAGVLVDAGAHGNTIGSEGAGERNVISGNTYEGITVSGDGTTDNLIITNLVGVSAVRTAAERGVLSRSDDDNSLPGRSAVSNGRAGIFLSKGTSGTQLGGDSTTQGNLVAHNSGSGIEVRDPGSKRNSARGNRITKNAGGGINLLDNSNEGVQPPRFTQVLPSRSPTAAPASARATTRVKITGAADSDGTVEVFTDTGTQGETLAGRAACVAGVWEIEVDVSDVENITATLTDANANTSAFAVYGSIRVGPDRDGDGVSNALEDLAGTSADDPSDAPFAQGAVVADKLSAALNFSAKGASKDSFKVTLRLVLPDGWMNPGATVGMLFGDAAAKVTLDAKGKSPRGNVSVKITPSKTGSGALISFAAKNQDMKASLASYSLSDRTTTKLGEPLTVPVAVALGTADGKKYVYIGSVNMVYKAVQGKTGKAAKAK